MAGDRGHLGWFLLGAAVGGLAAWLLRPRSGEENREVLSERGSDFARRALDRSRELVEEQTQRLMSAFEAGRDAMREEMRKGGSTDA